LGGVEVVGGDVDAWIDGSGVGGGIDSIFRFSPVWKLRGGFEAEKRNTRQRHRVTKERRAEDSSTFTSASSSWHQQETLSCVFDMSN
jgi:hypothetical protein